MFRKIFIGPTEIAGYYWNLYQGFRELNINAEFIPLTHHKFSYKEPDIPLTATLIRTFHKKYYETPSKKFLKKITFFSFYILAKILFFFRALLQYDVFIFGFGQTLLPKQIDLPIYRLFGKKTIFVFHGSDCRPDYLDGACLAKKSDPDCVLKIEKKKMILSRIERNADILINHPPQALLMERKFIQSLAIGLPSDSKHTTMKSKISSKNSIEATKRIRILHSPSNPEAKGTYILRKIINKLAMKYPIDWMEITNLPNKKVLQEIKNCDFVVDQLFSDTPMAGFATEAAWYKKSSVVGGYYADYLHMDLESDFIPPSEYVHPDLVEVAIEKLIVDEEYRIKLGEQAYQFVSKRWRRKVVAKNFLRIIQNDIPEHWWYDPKSLHYFKGSGASEDKIRISLQTMLELGNKDSLILDDKPELREALIEFCKESPIQ